MSTNGTFKIRLNPEVENYEKIKEEIEKNNTVRKRKQALFGIIELLLIISFFTNIAFSFQPMADLNGVLSVISFILMIVFSVCILRNCDMDMPEQLKLSKKLENTNILAINIQNNHYVSSIKYENSEHVVKEFECCIEVVEKTVLEEDVDAVLDLREEPLFIIKYEKLQESEER